MSRHRRTLLIPALMLALVGLAPSPPPGAAGASSSDWPQFRGLHRDGVSPATGLLSAWPEKGPREVWRRPIGEGFSAVTVVGDRIYTMDSGDHEGQPTEFALALEAASGKEIWRTPIGKKHDTEFGNGPRSTPTVEGGAAFVLGSLGDLVALDAATGAVRWKLNLPETFGCKTPHWGFSTSPILDAGLLILEGGGAEGKGFAGLDPATGTVRWTTGDSKGNPGYNSPLAVDFGGRRQYVTFQGDRLLALDGAGKELWTHPWAKGETHAMPVFIPPDRLFASGVEGVGATMFKMRAEASAPGLEEVWKLTTMRNHFSSSVANGGHIFGFDNATLKCISAADASLAWSRRGLGKGSLILADGNLLVLSDQGALLLVQATSEGYVEKGKVQALSGRSWTAPALAGRRLYLRNETEIVSYDLAS